MMRSGQLIIGTLCLSISSAFACGADMTPFAEYESKADLVFIGAVVEQHWRTYEEYADGWAKAFDPTGGIPFAFYRVGEYFKAVPLFIYKGKTDRTKEYYRPACMSMPVEGERVYVFMSMIEDGERVVAAYPFDKFPELVQFLNDKYNIRK